MEAIHQFAHQNTALFCAILVCAWISLSLMARLWLMQRSDSFWKKLGWTFVLCVPFFGWLLYGAFYTPLNENKVKAALNTDAFMGGSSAP